MEYVFPGERGAFKISIILLGLVVLRAKIKMRICMSVFTLIKLKAAISSDWLFFKRNMVIHRGFENPS